MRSIVWLMPGLVLLSCPAAMANVHDTFGVGAASIGMGNAQTSNARGGAAAYYNPAALGKVSSIQLDAGVQAFVPKFADFEGIVYDKNQNGVIDYDAEGNPETTTVSNRYAPSMGLGINAAIPITNWAAFGMSAYVPGQWLMRLGFEDVYVPYYPLYKNRTQRFSMYAGLGVKIFDGLYLGAGASASARLDVSGRLTSQVTVVSGQTDPDTGEALPSQISTDANLDELNIVVKGGFAPTLGILLNFGWLAEPLAGLDAGAVFRGESSVGTHTDIQAAAYGDITISDDRVYSGALTPAPISLQTDLISSYNPRQLAGGLSYTLWNRLTVSADATWTQWSKYQENYISQSSQIVIEGIALIDVQVGRDVYTASGDLDPGLLWHDTVTPRFGVEYTTGMPRGRDLGFQVTVRAGYGYNPSPVPEQVWKVNMMDSNKHMISGGLGFLIPMSRLAGPLRLDLFSSYHVLEARTHTKASELAPDADGRYPVGYPVGGTITSGGAILGFGATAGLVF